MSTWSKKRQAGIIGIIGLLVIVIGGIFYLKNQEPPSCFDGALNQDERGIDCGGSCEAVCQLEADGVAILWARVVPVVDDVYSAVAQVENPNLNFEARDVPYTFKLYDEFNVLIYERKGSTFFPSGSTFPVFEHALRTGERTPTRATFELREKPFWVTAPDEDIEVKIVSKTLSDEDTSPRLTAVVKNETFQILNEVEFVAMFFDKNQNLINASQTVVDRLNSEESETIVFTWPEPFGETIARTEIVLVDFVR